MVADSGLIDSVTQEFFKALSGDYRHIQTASLQLFYYLAVFQLTLTAARLSLIGESLQRVLIDVVKLMIIFSVYYACILNGGTWVPSILNFFVEIGSHGSVTSLSPSSVLQQGFDIFSAIWKTAVSWHFLTSPFIGLSAFVVCITVVIIYAFITAELCIMLVKTYILVCLSSLFFAFGGSEYTRTMATNYLKAVVGSGLKLLTIYLLLDVGHTLGMESAKIIADSASTLTIKPSIGPMVIILMTNIVFYMLVKNIPAFIANLSGVGGFYNYGDTAMSMAINTGFSGAQMMRKTYAATGKYAYQAGSMAGSAVGRAKAFFNKS